jgi:hypothetical protein
MEQFNQTMSRAAVQEADRLAKKLVVAAAKIKELDEEADCLFDSREKLVDEKRKRDFHIRLLKGELEARKTYPRGMPPGPSPDQLREQREAEEKQKKKDPEWKKKCKKGFENSPMPLYLKDVTANMARDRCLKHWAVRAQCFSARRQRALARRATASGGGPHVERPATPHPPCAATVAGRSYTREPPPRRRHLATTPRA